MSNKNFYGLLPTLLTLLLLTACGGGGGSDTPTTTNTLPVANAGTDQNITTLTTATLDGSASSDGDGDLITYRWQITSAPGASSAALSSTTDIHPQLTPDVDGVYVVALTVNDGKADSIADEVVITANTGNSAPVANAGPDQQVTTNTQVQLDGSGSSDANNDPLSYAWTIDSVPSGSSVNALSSAQVSDPVFTLDMDGSYVLSLIVNDGQVDSAADSITIVATSANLIPVAAAGVDANIPIASATQLDGSGSTDADGNIVSYNWSLTSKPIGSTTTLSNAQSSTPQLSPDLAGDYQVSLIVNDGIDDSLPDTVILTAWPTFTQEINDFAADYLASRGDELQMTFNLTTVSLDLLGVSYCFPSDPYASPAATSVPPTSIYGCDNNLSITYQATSATTARLIMTVPRLYIDFFVSGSGLSVDGYADITDIVVTVDVDLLNQGGGIYTVNQITAIDMTYNSFSVTVDNVTVQAILNATLSTLQTTIKDTLVAAIDSDLQTVIAAQSGFLYQ